MHTHQLYCVGLQVSFAPIFIYVLCTLACLSAQCWTILTTYCLHLMLRDHTLHLIYVHNCWCIFLWCGTIPPQIYLFLCFGIVGPYTILDALALHSGCCGTIRNIITKAIHKYYCTFGCVFGIQTHFTLCTTKHYFHASLQYIISFTNVCGLIRNYLVHLYSVSCNTVQYTIFLLATLCFSSTGVINFQLPYEYLNLQFESDKLQVLLWCCSVCHDYLQE